MTNLSTSQIVNRIVVLAIVACVSIEGVLLAWPLHDPVAQAQEGGGGAATEEADVPSSDVANACVDHMKIHMNAQKAPFAKFMNEHFRSKKPTSELIPAAIEEFKKYRAEAREEVQNFFLNKGLVAEAAITEINSCEKALKEDFTLMKVIIRTHISENAVAKKATRLLDKYKQINTKLDKLNFTIGQMAGYFGTLAQKLPCYATKCVKQ